MTQDTPYYPELTRSQRYTIVGAALLALFLGAMDALIVTAAMPTVVADLGGMDLFSWVYTTYFLSRAIALPIFGKLADLFQRRRMFLLAIAIFTLSSLAAGAAWNMPLLIITRVIQGIGSGGVFALVYIVLSDLSPPGMRGRTLSMASSIWGIASILGPTLGGIIVTYFSWRWIFWINIPLGVASYWGISTYLRDARKTAAGKVSLDFAGAATLTTAILAFLVAFLMGGRSYSWLSAPIVGVLALCLVSGLAFVIIEGRVRDPILSIEFFRLRGFSTGNGAVFLSSFAIFALFAFAPIYIQGVQGKSPMVVGAAMLAMSLGWSLGSLILGLFIQRVGLRPASLIGALGIMAGSIMTFAIHSQSGTLYSFVCFFIIGAGMGFLSLATLIVVQASVAVRDLGVATSSNQFARTLGGTVGVGICGSLMNAPIGNLAHRIEQTGILDRMPSDLAESGLGQIENMLQPHIQAIMPPELKTMVHQAVSQGIHSVLWAVAISAVLCVMVCLFIPGKKY